MNMMKMIAKYYMKKNNKVRDSEKSISFILLQFMIYKQNIYQNLLTWYKYYKF